MRRRGAICQRFRRRFAVDVPCDGVGVDGFGELRGIGRVARDRRNFRRPACKRVTVLGVGVLGRVSVGRRRAVFQRFRRLLAVDIPRDSISPLLLGELRRVGNILADRRKLRGPAGKSVLKLRCGFFRRRVAVIFRRVAVCHAFVSFQRLVVRAFPYDFVSLCGNGKGNGFRFGAVIVLAFLDMRRDLVISR